MRRLLRRLRLLLTDPNRVFLDFAPPGHFYSPLPDREQLGRERERLFDRTVTDCPGIDLRVEAQLALLERLAPHGRDLPFHHDRRPDVRYWFDNSYFSYGDATVLAALLRDLRPRRVVEVGSGFSTAVLLDIDERDLGGATDLLLVEPYPDRLRSLLRPGDLDRVRLREERIQDVPLAELEALEAGDIFFVDSSHALKCGSDVHWILFHVLPRLRPGVLIHVHDVHWPFEYPEGWFGSGIAWNEAYALRAFLQYNQSFEILLFTSYLEHHHRDRLARDLPLALRRPDDRTTPSNGSLWLRKTS